MIEGVFVPARKSTTRSLLAKKQEKVVPSQPRASLVSTGENLKAAGKTKRSFSRLPPARVPLVARRSIHMSVSWVVSGHEFAAALKNGIGAPESSRAHSAPVTVPNGVRLYFFVDEGAPLPVDQGWHIYHLLMKKDKTVEDLMNLRRLPGLREHTEPTVTNYLIQGDARWVDPKTGKLASGIFVMDDEDHMNPMTYYLYPGASNPADRIYSLKKLFTDGRRTWRPGDEVYWVACRSRMN
jgi:hypothetical protein